jgi:hypothetical protein
LHEVGGSGLIGVHHSIQVLLVVLLLELESLVLVCYLFVQLALLPLQLLLHDHGRLGLDYASLVELLSLQSVLLLQTLHTK